MQYSKKKNKELVDRFYMGEVPRKGVWFKYKDFSILNAGKLMETAPLEWTGFSGWEALDKKGNIIRKKTVEELLKILTNP